MTETQAVQSLEEAESLLHWKAATPVDTIESIMNRIMLSMNAQKNGDTMKEDVEKYRKARLTSLVTTMNLAGFPSDISRSCKAVIERHGLQAGSKSDITARFIAQPGAIGLFSQKLSQTPEKFAAYIAACCHWYNGSGIGYITPPALEENAPLSFSPSKVGMLVISNVSSAIGFSMKRIVSLVSTRILSSRRTIVTSYGEAHDNELVEHLRSSFGIIEM